MIYGDCSSPEIVTQAVRVLDKIAARHGHNFTYTRAYMGGEAIDKFGDPLLRHPNWKNAKTLTVSCWVPSAAPSGVDCPAKSAPKGACCGCAPRMGLYANNRPAKIWPQLADASPLKKSIVDKGIGLYRRA